MLFGEVEFLVGEKWSEKFESDTVAYLRRETSVDALDRSEGEESFAFAWWAHKSFYHVSCLETVVFDLLKCHHHIVG